MTILDRYLGSIFIRTFLVCFLSFTGLFVVLHLFSNLDELQVIGDKIGWWGVFQEFYFPRIADLYDKSAGILILVAAVFAVSLLQRRREMTAMEGSGLTKFRILRPVLFLSLIFVGLTIANRELLIPQLKDQLVRTPQNWAGQGQVEMEMRTDPSNVTIRGDQYFLAEKRITSIEVFLPPLTSQPGTITASARTGDIRENEDWRPAGILLDQVSNTKRHLQPSLKDEDGETILFSPVDHKWLEQDQLFVRCNFNANDLAYGRQTKQYQSTAELINESRQPKRWANPAEFVSIHSRLVRPLMDISLLLLGLPLVIGGIERNVFVSAGLCFWIIASVQLTTMVCYSLGASSLIRPAALAAWTPVLIFVPAALVAMRSLRR
jgi:lipopolysaccharide export system permease protein